LPLELFEKETKIMELIKAINDKYSKLKNAAADSQEIENAVEKTKYKLSEGFELKCLLSDSIARLLKDGKTHCCSVYLDLEKRENTTKDYLKKIYACAKMHQDEQDFRKNVFNILKFCSNPEMTYDINFLSQSKKTSILDKIKKFTNYASASKEKNNSSNSETLLKQKMNNKNKMKELVLIKKIVKGVNEFQLSENVEKNQIESLYFLIIFIFDLITLPDLFKHNFLIDSADNDVRLEEKISCFFPESVKFTDQHPDSVIAYKLSTLPLNSPKYNRYVGVSLMPCLYCHLFLESFDFEFRGLASTIHKRWLMPKGNETITEVIFDNFNKKLENLKKTLEREENFLPTKNKDTCQHTCKNMSDDVSVYYNFLKNNGSNMFIKSLFTDEIVEDILKVLYDKREICVRNLYN
jgi:hypothetical protein